MQMDINQNYREAVQVIKEAILRSQYRAVASVNKEQLSFSNKHKKYTYFL